MVRDSIKSKPETEPKKQQHRGTDYRPRPSKYDHWQMIQDRMSGMTWKEIGTKHGINKSDKELSLMILHSGKIKLLKPKEVEKLMQGRKEHK